MKEHLKKLGRISIQGLIWLFVFSITINGRTLFSHGHSIFVDNQVVAAIDDQATDLFYRVIKTVQVTYRTMTGQEGKRG